ncbi:MAG TPA: hypothetical protein VF060_22905 [Trebonia sp.]
MSEPDAADEIEAAGGDPACWAGLVCLECGSVISEGHRDGCSMAAEASGREPGRGSQGSG